MCTFFPTGVVGSLSTAQPSIKALQTLPSDTDHFTTTDISYGSEEYSSDTIEVHKGEDSEELMKVKTVKKDEGGNQQSERGSSSETPKVHQQANVIGYNESDPMLRLSGSEMEAKNDTGETQHDTEITEVMVSDETIPAKTAVEVEDRARNDTHGEVSSPGERRVNSGKGRCQYTGLHEGCVLEIKSEEGNNSRDKTMDENRYTVTEDTTVNRTHPRLQTTTTTTTATTEKYDRNESRSSPKPPDSRYKLETLIMSSVPKECWMGQWNSSLVETFADNFNGIQTHWLKNYSSSCYDKVNTDYQGKRFSGNIFVLTVMAKSKLFQETTFIIRASLASADLLMGLVPASLAVYDHISLMNGRLTLRDLSNDFLLTSFPYIVASQSPGFQQLRFQRKSFLPVLASFTFNVSAMVSLLTLALLSLERLWVMRGRPLSRKFMVRGVLLSWLVGLLLSFLVSWRKEGIELAGYFDPVTKLTLNIGAGATSVSGWVFYLEVSVMGVAGTTVIVCGITTLVLFMSHNRLSSSILKIHSSNRDNEVRRTTIIFGLMVVMFIIGVGLVAVDITANLAVTNPLAHWFSWWVFVAASSWNWALYTLSGGRFRNQIRNLLPRVQVQHTKGVKNTTKAQQISFGRKRIFTKHIPREKSVSVELKGFARSYTLYSK
ncbi:hypothetical protein Pmani_005762 [Petrolisthes manimaculis]|uniref:G-protein coupled receptors family 1 profile domain-containing protein n=1 Tax=Petrolisthes manimaculis TaxID=1843537 RepID=A0AAE1QBR1_9EUCA|nr:hypothetical protein Pmani_005762 [Petrolisthes manimaculis]